MKPVRDHFIIKGEKIDLRPITAEDTEIVLGWRNAKDVVENYIYREPVTVEEHKDWLENKVAKGLVHQFIVCIPSSGVPIGSVYLQKFDEESRKAESGIFMSSSAPKGCGVGTEAVKLLVEYGFKELGLHKIVARVLAYNTASLRLHEKAGYKREAYLKDELFIDGKYEDLVFYGIINAKDSAFPIIN